jgi:hypothetical protein
MAYRKQLDALKESKVSYAHKLIVLHRMVPRQCFRCKQPIPAKHHCTCEAEYVK